MSGIQTKMASTSTRVIDTALDIALAAIPSRFRQRLTNSYYGLRSAFSNGQHDACGLRAGIFCEVTLRFLQHHLTGTSIPFGAKINNFADECAKLERLPSSVGHESLRVLIPRALTFLYTLRNKRGIGHVGGDIDANSIDAATAVRIADWCICEFIRIFHAMPFEEAQALLDAISIRQLPQVWSVAGKNRILDPSIDFKSQTLLLLYNSTEPGIPSEDLYQWTEYSQFSAFRKDVLLPLHKARLVEYDRETEVVIISPRGIKRVEEELLPKLGRQK